MWQNGELPWPWWWCGPTYLQARREFLDLCAMAHSAGVLDRNTTTAPLEGRLKNGARFEARTWESAKYLQGPTVAGFVLDEWGLLYSEAYAVLSARRAETIIHGYGFMRGYGNVGDVASFAETLWDAAVAGEPNTAYRRWTWRDRAAALSCSCEIEDAMDYRRVTEHDGDCQRRTYLVHVLGEARRLSGQEFGRMYNAEWENATDLPVYVFERHAHVSESAVYVPGLPIDLCCDFNVDPMAWTMGQQRREIAWTFDEIEIPGGGTSRQAIQEFVRRFPDKRSQVRVFGDRSGRSRDTRGLQSDYDIIKDGLAGYDFEFHVPASNPAVKARVNAVNARLRSATGEVRYQLHPRCRKLIRDLGRVSWKPGTREIEKTRDKTLTHFSDGVGYWLASVYPTVRYNEPGVYIADAPLVDDAIMGMMG